MKAVSVIRVTTDVDRRHFQHDHVIFLLWLASLIFIFTDQVNHFFVEGDVLLFLGDWRQ